MLRKTVLRFPDIANEAKRHLTPSKRKRLEEFLAPNRGSTNYEEKQLRFLRGYAIANLHPTMTYTKLEDATGLDRGQLWHYRNGKTPVVAKNPDRLRQLLRHIEDPNIRKFLRVKHL